jgi:RNA polymerase-associated protein RTF1
VAFQVKYVEAQSDLEPIRLSRFKMERFVYLPFFKRLVTGCFVRIGIGDAPDGRPVYRCAEIIEVVETAKVYHLGKVRTNVGLKLRHGKEERMFRLEFISNQPLTSSEFEKWRYTCEERNIPLPTRDFVQSKSDEIKKALSYEYSSSDVDAILQKKEKFNKNPVNYAMTKARLMKEKEIAQAENDTDALLELDKKLNELEQRAEELDRKRTEKSSISSVSFINNRNRKNNVLKAEQAIQEELKRKEREGVEDNPFTRRKCNPRMVTNSSGGQPIPAEFLKKLAEKENQVRRYRTTSYSSVVKVYKGTK